MRITSVYFRLPQKQVLAFDMVSGEKEEWPEMALVRAHCTSVVCDRNIYVFGGWTPHGSHNVSERYVLFNAEFAFHHLQPNGSSFQIRHQNQRVVQATPHNKQ